MWVARDKNNNIKLFNVKPIRDEIAWKEEGVFQHYLYIDEKLFPDLKWEDESIEVSIVSKEYLNHLEVIQDEYEKVNDTIQLKRFRKEQKENINKPEVKKE